MGSAAPLGLFVLLMVLIPQALMGGVMINLNQIPPGWIWAREISVFRYDFEVPSGGSTPCREAFSVPRDVSS